jgi:hypothetical protein
MSQTTATIPGVPDISAFELKVSARGAMIRAFFGSCCLFWTIVFSGHKSPLWFSILTVSSVGLFAWAIRRVRATRKLPTSADDIGRWMAVRKFYWLDVGLEWGLCGVAAFVLAEHGRFDLLPQALGVIIGVHYLALGKIFRMQQFYWTGGVMVVAELATLLIQRGHIRTIAGFAALGLTLWITCVAVLWWTSSAVGGQAKTTVPRNGW